MTEVWRITGDSLLVAGSKPPKTKFRSDLEKLEKKVVDAENAWDAWDAADAADAEDAAWVALVKAKRDLFKYLKEQDDD